MAHQIRRRTIGGQDRGSTYKIAERTSLRFEGSEEFAIRLAVQDAHREAHVPPWGPYFRESLAHASAERVTWRPEGVATG